MKKLIALFAGLSYVECGEIKGGVWSNAFETNYRKLTRKALGKPAFIHRKDYSPKFFLGSLHDKYGHFSYSNLGQKGKSYIVFLVDSVTVITVFSVIY